MSRLTLPQRSGLWVFVIALTIRSAFALFLAGPYFGRPDVRIHNDTRVFTAGVVNLIQTGTYTTLPGSEYGFFGRTPGYPMFIGAFYGLAGGNVDRAYDLIAAVQIVLDSIAAVLMLRIGATAFSSAATGGILGLLYATYPFVVVWTPTVMSEAFGVFCMIVSLYSFVCGTKTSGPCWAGVWLGVGALTRPQLALLAPLLALAILWKSRDVRAAVVFSLAVGLTFSPWPLRNYFLHGKIVLTQDLRGFPGWGADTLAFMRYIFATKPEWEPQFSSIVMNEPVSFPEEAFAIPTDAPKLSSAVELAKDCSYGFRWWHALRRQPVSNTPDCTAETARLFDELRVSQYESNRINSWLVVPFGNLYKGVFKSQTYDNRTPLRRLASRLFLYRTTALLGGILCAVLLVLSRSDGWYLGALSLGYLLLLYGLLCFGTAQQCRNIEMRYFLPVDVLLLVPLAAQLAQRLSLPAWLR